MKETQFVWLPIFGIRFVTFNPLIVFYTPWLIYQAFCIVALASSIGQLTALLCK